MPYLPLREVGSATNLSKPMALNQWGMVFELIYTSSPELFSPALQSVALLTSLREGIPSPVTTEMISLSAGMKLFEKVKYVQF